LRHHRGGGIVGDHTVLFALRVSASRSPQSSSRATYAQGRLRAARFHQPRSGRLFDMLDVNSNAAEISRQTRQTIAPVAVKLP
jgi:dihydrodipicolinate reductase